ncbi:MAG: hypothetical protein ACFFD4_20645 [Candidatus Odinarchaeota archaeon]
MQGKPFDCNVCNRKFIDKHALEQHLEAKHPVHCECCLEIFKDRKALDQHLQNKRKERELNFELVRTPTESPSRPSVVIYGSTVDPGEYKRELVRRRKVSREMERDR